MAWSWGGAALGADRGVQALVDLLQKNAATDRQTGLDADAKAERDAAAKDRADARRRQALIDLPGMQDRGGFVTESSVTPPDFKAPDLSGAIGAKPPRPDRQGVVTSARRPLVLGDLLSSDANIGYDETQSRSAIQQRTQGAALQRFAQTKSPADRAAALSAGVAPAQLDEIDAKPTAPKDTAPLWGPGTQFPTQADYLKFEGAKATATRAPEQEVWHDPVTETGAMPDGSPQQIRVQYSNRGTRRVVPDAQPAAKAGQAAGGAGGAEQIKKAEQLGLALTNYSDLMPAMEKRQFQGPGLVTGIASAMQHAGGVEGSVGNFATNVVDRDWNTLSGNIDLLLSAAAHSVGGARITPEQVKMFTGGFVPGSGDNSAQGKQKLERAMDFLNASAAVLPPEMVTNQLQRIPADRLKVLQSYGFGKPPTPEAIALVEKMQQAVNAPANAPPGAGGRAGQHTPATTASPAQALWDAAVKLHGEAKVLQEYGPRPPN